MHHLMREFPVGVEILDRRAVAHGYRDMRSSLAVAYAACHPPAVRHRDVETGLRNRKPAEITIADGEVYSFFHQVACPLRDRHFHADIGIACKKIG